MISNPNGQQWIVRTLCVAPYPDVPNIDITETYDTESEAVRHVRAIRSIPSYTAFRVDCKEANGTMTHIGATVFKEYEYCLPLLPESFVKGTEYEKGLPKRLNLSLNL